MKAFRHRFWKFIFIFCHSGGKEKKNENCLRNPNAFLYFIHFDKQYKAQKGITGLGRLGRFTQPFWYRVCQPLGVMIDHVACFFSSINTPGLLRFQILGFLARRRETRRNRSEDGLRFLSLSRSFVFFVEIYKSDDLSFLWILSWTKNYSRRTRHLGLRRSLRRRWGRIAPSRTGSACAPITPSGTLFDLVFVPISGLHMILFCEIELCITFLAKFSTTSIRFLF